MDERMRLHSRPPSAAVYMLGAMARGERRGPGPFPELRLRWAGFRIGTRQRRAIGAVTGLGPGPALDALAPWFTGFRALMALLTDRAMPLPIWRSLQVRNRILAHRPAPEGAALVLEAGVAAQRALEKGAELDLHTTVADLAGPVWESLNTFYYRGPPMAGVPAAAPSASARPPEAAGAELAGWHAPRGGGWHVGALTGDYNPLHWSEPMARRRGFAGAFLHPQVALGQCQARLPAPGSGPLLLEVWVRGQVYQGAHLALFGEAAGGSCRFALRAGDEARPALLGRWAPGQAGQRLA